MITPDSVKIANLGPRKIRSPLPLTVAMDDGVGNFIPDEDRVRYAVEVHKNSDAAPPILFEKAGPREHLYFNPAESKAAIVTCGGLCPGINNVIRSLYRQLHIYGVEQVLGIQYGFQGMNFKEGLAPILLTSDSVEDIHKVGGTVLGSSRGPQDPATLVDFLQYEGINLFFCIGGDGTQRGAHGIYEEIQRRNAEIVVVGVPKTIDNDLMYISRSFGFETAIEVAKTVLDCAHVEAKGAPNGIGLVKVMGRDSGFIAAMATLASQEVNFTLIPEVPFDLEGPHGFLTVLHKRIQRKRHAVVVVAEGAGQDLMPAATATRDASGNLLHKDIGTFLRDKIITYFAEQKVSVNVKYIDPSYIIRSVPANCSDSLLCDQLARRAVDAGMAGKTDALIGYWNSEFVHIPIPLAVEKKKKINPEGELWVCVYEATGQPMYFKPPLFAPGTRKVLVPPP